MARPAGGQDLVQRSVQFPRHIDALWAATAKKVGVNKTTVLILALQEFAERKNVTLPEEDKQEVVEA